jgi:hypothetical protein
MAFWTKRPPTPPVDWHVRAALLPSMFVADTEFPGKHKQPIFVTPAQVGVLRLPTGRVIGGDINPFEPSEATPYDRQAPIGEFAVEVSLAELAKDESRIAAARIVFSSQPIASWEIATGATGLMVASAPNGAAGFKGTRGVYLDAATLPVLATYISGRDEITEWYRELPKQEGRLWTHWCFQPDTARPENVAMYDVGGDYENVVVSYWGLDTAGNVAVLVTDCNVIP